MANTASEKLSGLIVRLLNPGESSHSDSIDVMRLSRQVLEKNDPFQILYPVLWIYCNWTMHNELDRKPVWPILKMVDKALVDLGGQQNMSLVIKEVSRAFKLAELRQELIKLFHEEKIPTDLFESLSNWLAFLGNLLADIAEKPITFPKDIKINVKAGGRSIYDEMVSYREKAKRRIDMTTTTLLLLNRSNEPGVPGRPSGFYWALRSNEQSPEVYAEFNGILELTETPADFKGT